MVPSWGEATVVSREQGGQVSAPNEAGRQRRGPEAVPQCPRHRDSAVESKQRQGERNSNEAEMAGSRAAVLPPGLCHPRRGTSVGVSSVACQPLRQAPAGLHASPLVPSRQKPSRPRTATLFL